MSDPVTIGGAIGSGLGIGFGIPKAMSRWLPARNTNGHHRAPCADLVELKEQVTVIDKSLAVLSQVTTDGAKANAEGFSALNKLLDEMPRRRK